MVLHGETSIYNIEDAVKPSNFDEVVRAVKIWSGYDEETNRYKTPSLALKLGHSLQKVSGLVHCRALQAEDNELQRSAENFKKLYSSKWDEVISHSALNTESSKVQ